MAVDVVVPSMGESVTMATISRWKKKVGDVVKVEVEGIGTLENHVVEEPADTAIL